MDARDLARSLGRAVGSCGGTEPRGRGPSLQQCKSVAAGYLGGSTVGRVHGRRVQGRVRGGREGRGREGVRVTHGRGLRACAVGASRRDSSGRPRRVRDAAAIARPGIGGRGEAHLMLRSPDVRGCHGPWLFGPPFGAQPWPCCLRACQRVLRVGGSPRFASRCVPASASARFRGSCLCRDVRAAVRPT